MTANMDTPSEPRGIARWTAFCIKNYKITIIVILALMIGGVWGVFTNQRQDFPSIPINFIIVQASYPQASPQDVEQDILMPLEPALEEIDGVTEIRSTARQHGGSITLELEDFSSNEEKVAKAEEIISSAGLPSEADVSASLIDAAGPSITVALTSNNNSTLKDLLALAPSIQQRIQNSSSDIKEVQIQPDDEFQVRIELDEEKLAAAQVSALDVRAAIQGAIQILPGGTLIQENGLQQPITIETPIDSLDNIRNIDVNGNSLDSLARVERTPKDTTSISLAGYIKDGTARSSEVVYLNVIKKDDGDIVKMSQSVHEALQEIEDNSILPAGMFTAIVYDTAPDIQRQISTLVSNGVIGLIVILVVLLFVVNLRAAIVVSLILPFAFLVGLFVLPLLGYTLNILTLFALILTLGIIVDNAIVIAEGIVYNINKGLKKKEAAIKAIQQFGPAVTAATLTTVIVFIPFANLGGIIGEFMKFIPYTIIIMLVASYFLAMTITPLMATWILKKHRENEPLKKWQKMLVLPLIVRYAQKGLNKVQSWYKKLLVGILASKGRRIATVIVTMLCLVGSIGVFASRLEFEQFPSNDGEVITVTAEFPIQASQDERREILGMVGEELTSLPHFKSYFYNQGMLFATFTPADQREDGQNINEIADLLEPKLQEARNAIGPRGAITASAAGVGPTEDNYDITVEVRNNNDQARKEAIDILEQSLEREAGIEKVYNQITEEQTDSVRVVFNDERLNERGLTAQTASAAISGVFGQQTVGQVLVEDSGLTEDIVLTFGDDAKQSIDDINSVILAAPQAAGQQPVRVADVATVTNETSGKTIGRLDKVRTNALKVRLSDASRQLEIEDMLKNRLTDEQLQGWNMTRDDIQFGGAFEESQSNQESLAIVFILAIILVYIVLVYQFRSFGQPLLILLTIPIALVGVFPGLLIVGSSMNMIAGLGVVALVGIVVNDAIVFIDYYNRRRKSNPKASLKDVLADTGYARFKPILTTSLTTIAGILPLTLRDPFWVGLGTSIVAGLIFSTIGTLLAIPVFMHWFTRKPKKSKSAPKKA